MERLTILSAAFSVVGLVGIYILSAGYEPDLLEISDITQDLSGETVKTEGTVYSVNRHDAGHIFLTITDGDVKIQSPIFKDVAEKMDWVPSKGQKISVTGVVDTYKKSVQVIPRKPSDVAPSLEAQPVK